MSLKKKIEEMKNATCGFPTCKEKAMIHVSVPLLYKDENGKLKQIEGGSVGLPICEKHLPVISCGCFGARETEKGTVLEGNIDAAIIAEAVFQGLMFSDEIEKIKKAKESAKKLIEVENDG